jgi:plasmid maintenance system antidote protein VapI
VPDTSGRIIARGGNPRDRQNEDRDRDLLGISRQHLYDILEERKPVSPAVAVRLGKLFGDGAGVWVRMQSAYDTWHAERELAKEIKKIPTLKPAAA